MKKLGSRHENLDLKVYRELKTMIVDRKLKPGDKILQEKISREFGVSRTPLMCALKKLEQEKLVQALPRRGFYVRRFTMEEVLEAFELREILEGLAARRAAVVITAPQAEKLRTFFQEADVSDSAASIKRYSDEDRRFHLFLVELGGFDLLNDILENYNIITVSYRIDLMEGLVRHPRETLPEHHALIEAIAAGKPDQAEKIARQHFNRSRQRLLREMNQK
ncbi:MAG TPA: GntR family transcriptional regulator [Syntrophales bacterium]|nr:GntR family transcriptional regulator [Syntrophales bacterium]